MKNFGKRWLALLLTVLIVLQSCFISPKLTLNVFADSDDELVNEEMDGSFVPVVSVDGNEETDAPKATEPEEDQEGTVDEDPLPVVSEPETLSEGSEETDVPEAEEPAVQEDLPEEEQDADQPADDSEDEQPSEDVPSSEADEPVTEEPQEEVPVEDGEEAGELEPSATEGEDQNQDDPDEENSPEDTEPVEEPEDLTVTMPAKEFMDAANGFTIVVTAPVGAFPKGTTMKATAVYDEDVIDAISDAVDADVKSVKAVDIKFFDAEKNEIEPVRPISVVFLSNNKLEKDTTQIAHVDEKGEVSVIENPEVTKTSVEFSSDEFSIYAIVETGTDARIKVVFKGLYDRVIDSMYVKQNDDMEVVLYDPGTGGLADGVYFRGWTTDPDYTTITAAKTIEDVRTEVSGMLPPNTDGKEVTYYAMLFKDYRVTYLDENDISLGQEEVTFRADSTATEQDYTVNMGYTVQDDIHHFEGWNVVQGGSNIDGYTSGNIYQNNDVITITGDITFGVNAPEGHWFIFDENGKGATYNAPQFVYSSDKPTRPNDSNMLRNGYTFGGWFADKSVADQTSGGTQYDFSQTLSDRVIVYARWIPKTEANYTIIIWRQNLAGDGYDFVESISRSGSVGSTISTVRQQGSGNNAYAQVQRTGNQWSNIQYNGFHLKEFDSNVTINTEGNSVLNVYYDRNQHTLQFQIYDYTYTVSTNDNDNNPSKYGDVNGVKARVYWNNGAFRTSNSRYGTVYTGTVYTRSNNQSWQTIKSITALYGQSISSNFPIVGSNGVTYDNGERWMPQGSSTYSNVLIYIDIMPNEDVTFHLNEAFHSTKNIYYYVEALPEETGETVSYNGKTFVLYKHMSANYGFFTEAEDYLDFVGFSKFGYTPNNAWGSNGADTVFCYYTRNVYPINFMDGKYVNGDNGPINEAGIGQIATKEDISYGADVSSNNNYKPEKTPSGYVFEGWFLDDACTQPYTFNTMPEGGITVYAKWRQKQYRVFLHPNYPAGATGNIDWGTETQAMNFRISEGGHVSEPTGRLNGFEFVGWYLDEGCTQVFNGEAYTINEDNVTADYDKTVDMTDTYDNNGNLIDPKRNSDATGYNGEDRFWITKKLDIYAKWRSTLDGASGIVVEYDANGGTGAPTDTHTYVDGANAPAGAASKSSDNNKVFGHWIVQKWNGSAWEDTDEKVLPGDTFTVLASNAKVEEIENPTQGGDTKKYTVKLKAEYIDSEEPTPTHIYWYKNDGSDAYIKKENVAINVGVHIPQAPTREGYEFLGWARVNIGNTQEAASAWEANRTNWTQDLTTSNLYLYYAEDDKYHLGSTTGTTVTQVAPDENMPYHAMFAVWEEREVTINYAVATNSTGMGTVDPTSETIKAISGTAVGSTANATSDMYIIDYWTCDEGTEPVGTYAQFVPSKNNGVYEEHTYYAHFKLNKATVIVHHYLKGTTTKVAEDVTSEETIGTEYTAIPVTKYQEKDLTVDSYNPSQKVTVLENGNTITIYYTLPLTINAKTDSKTYDGAPLDGAFTITGALASDQATIEEALGEAPSITDVSDGPKTYLTEAEQEALQGIPSYYVVTYVPGTLSIDKREVNLSSESGEKPYDGTPLTKPTVSGWEQVDNETAHTGFVTGEVSDVKATGSVTTVAEGEVTNTITYTEGANFKADNYTIKKSEGKLKITAREITVSVEDKTVEYNGSEQSGNTAYTFANVVEGQTATITYTPAKGTLVNTYDNGAYADDLSIVDVNGNDVTGNYNLTTKTAGKLTITNKTDKYEITVVANSNTGNTYDGTEKSATGFETLEFTVEGNKYTVSGLTTSNPSSTDVCTLPNAISGTAVVKDAADNDVTAQFTVKTTNGTLEISKKTVTVSVADADPVEYDGNEHVSDKPVVFSGILSGQNATITYTPAKGTLVGTYTGSYGDDFKVMAGEKEVTANYELTTKTPGNLQITDRTEKYEVTVVAKSNTGNTYDGTVKSATGFETLEFTVEGNKYTVSGLTTSDSSSTDVCTLTNAISGTAVVKDAAGNDVTTQFTVNKTNGTLEISKRPVTLTSADGEKVFDGKALTKNAQTDVTVGGEGFVTGEGATYDITGTQTEVGESKNTFTYKLNDGTKAGNYEITTTEGTLKVTAVTDKVTVTITENSGKEKYDGKEKTVTGYTVKISNPLYTESDFTFSGTAEVKGTDADTYEMELKPADFTNKSKNFNNVEFVIVDGTLEISKREVTLTSESGEKPYDGTPLTKPEVTVSGDGFVEGEVTEIKATGSVTTVEEGEVANTITYTEGEKFKAGNYKITKAEGKLKITSSKGKLVIISSTKSWTYDGELHVDDVYTVTYDGKDAEKVVNRRMRLMAMARPAPEPQVFLLSTGDTVTITSTAEGVVDYSDSYNENNTYTYVITNAANYSDVTANVGTLSIDKRGVTLTSESASKVYDGTALTNDKVTVGEDGFAKGEEVTFTVTGTQTLVGESKNTFTYTLGEGMKAENYDIKITEGTLTVTDGSDTPDEPVKDDLVVTKTAEDKAYKLGEEVKFTITVTNIYEETKTIKLEEVEGVTLAQSIFENVKGGETITTEATYKIKEEDILKGSFENTVKATEGNITKEAKAIVKTEEANPHLKVDKVTTSKPADGKNYKLGETITYEITVTNDGNLTITAIEVEDKLTNDKWDIEKLAPEESQTFKAEHVVTEDDILAGTVLNEATATGKGPEDKDPEPTPGTSKDPTDPKRSHLTVVKETTSEPKNGKTYDLGEKITYRITVTNDGNLTISDIVVTDELTGDKWTIESLAPGASEEFEASYTVIAADQKAGSVINEATATGKDPEGKEPDVVPGVDEEPTTEPEPDVPQTGTAKETVILTSMSAGSMLLAIWLMLIRKKRKEEE